MIRAFGTSAGMANLPEVTDTTFDQTVLASPLPVLVDFSATWCAPCRTIEPHVEALAKAYEGRVRVVKCDVDESTAVAARFGIRGVPTLLVFAGGKVAGQLVGSAPRARLEALVDRVLDAAPRPATLAG
jgi:thioredoxin 1